MKSLLFLCVENRVSSQITEGLARHFIGHQYDIFSAGSKPAERVHPMAVAVLAEIGIEIAAQRPKSINQIDLSKIDTAIIMCAESEFSNLPAKIKRQIWPTTIPTDESVEIREDLLRKFRKIRDDLRKRVLELRASDQTW